MIFYLNNEQVNVRTLPQLQLTKDSTLDNFSVVLEANNIANAIAPCSNFRIEKEGEVFNFIVISDKVTLMSTSPYLYTHELQLTQNIKKLDLHLIRNTVFSQPTNNEKIAFTSFTNELMNENNVFSYRIAGGSSSNKWVEKVHISKKDKIKNIYVRVKLLKPTYDENYSATLDEIKGISLKDYLYSGFYQPGSIPLKIYGNNGLLVSVDLNYIILGEWIETSITDIGEDDIYAQFDYDVLRGDKVLNEQSDAFRTYQIEVKVEYYYYNAYDMLEILLKQHRKKTDKYENEMLFNLPSDGELYDLLNETIPPPMTFTQSSFFDAVADIFKLFDAIFTLDENNVLGIEYFNELNERKIEDKSVFSGMQQAHSENNFRNGLVSYYQNAIAEESFPKKQFSHLRNSELGIPTSEDNWNFFVPYNIDYIKKVYFDYDYRMTAVIYNTGSTQTLYFDNLHLPLDLTPFVYENNLYSLLDETNTFPISGDYQNKTKANAITYSKGTDFIAISSNKFRDAIGQVYLSIDLAIITAIRRFFGFPKLGTSGFTLSPSTLSFYGGDWLKYKFRLEYYTNINGRAKIETPEFKYKGDMLVNQSSGRINLNKLGLNMVGLSLKLGQPTLAFTHKISPFANRVKKGDIYEDEEGNIWVANVCTYTILDEDTVQGNIEFSKNFNALSTNVRIDDEKRLTNISNELTIKCEDDYCEYLYFAQTNDNVDVADGNVVLDNRYLSDAIQETLFPEGTFESVDSALFSAKYEDKSDIDFGEEKPAQNIYIPLIKYGFGNAICFEMSFVSPISAGKQTTQTGNKYYTTEYLYTDDDGWCDLVNIDFVQLDENSFSQNFPYIDSSKRSKGEIINLEYFKKPNEIFALNYELICLTLPNRENIDFIGSAFINNNALVKGKSKDKTYLHYETSEDFKYSFLDKYGNNSNVKEVLLSSTLSTLGVTRIRISAGLSERPKAWALCNSNREILVASNECLDFNEQTGTLTIYFFNRHSRIKNL